MTTPTAEPITLDEAREQLSGAMQRMAATDPADFAAMSAAVEDSKRAMNLVARLNKEAEVAAWEEANGERLRIAAEIEAAEPYKLHQKAFELGVVSILITPEGTKVNTGAKPKTTRTASANGTGATKGRHQISYKGEIFGSKGFLTRLSEEGNEYAADALDRAVNWEARGLKAAPGFDSAVKKLVGETDSAAFV